MPKCKVNYEWDCEEVNADGDVVEHHHSNNLREAIERRGELLAQGRRADIVLVRNLGNEHDGIVDRQWAYLVDGRLPEEFSGRAVVPRQFHRNCSRVRRLSILTGRQ